MKEVVSLITILFMWVVIAAVPLAAWGTHIVTCLNTDSWRFLIAGAVLAPIGVIHGVGLWFGAW